MTITPIQHTKRNIILVDSEDHKIDVIEKVTAHEYGMLHRAFSIFIFRKRNNTLQCLLQERNKDKYHTGGLWTNTCCSHSTPNENFFETAEKRLLKEMGFTTKLYYVGKFHYVAPFANGLTENEMDRVFIGTYDEDEIPVNPKEVDAYEWVEVNQLKKDLAAHPNKYTPWLKQGLEIAVAAMGSSNWFPDKESIKSTNLWHLMQIVGLNDYQELHRWSVTHYPEFWQRMVEMLHIVFDKTYSEIVDLSHGLESPRWFKGAKLNIAKSCFNAKATDIAIIEQTSQGEIKKTTYAELNQLSNRVAKQIRLYFKPGDRIAVIMPMGFEAVAIYLGVIKAGCCVVSIAESFSVEEIAIRLQIASAAGVFTQNQITHKNKRIPLYEKIKKAHAPLSIVLSDDECTLRENDIRFEEFLGQEDEKNEMSSSKAYHDIFAVSCHPDNYINILFSSGTTGEPKAVPWTHTTPIKCGSDACLHQNIQPGDVVCWPTSLGWMMGPWSIFASLLNQATLAIYHGMPNEKEFGEFVQNAKVTVLGVVPTLVRNWRNTKCMEDFDWSAIKLFSSSGECSQPDDMAYLSSLAQYRPIIEYCGGTEIGGAYITSTLMQPLAPSSFTTPAMGLDFKLIDTKGVPTYYGEVVLVPPSIGLSTILLNKDHHKVYYAHMPSAPSGQLLRRHGDLVEKYADGLYRLHGRIDDTINLGGIKTSLVEIESVLHKLTQLLDVAAIAIEPPDGGPSLLVIYVVAKSADKHQLQTEMQNAIKTNLNPLFKIHEVVIVDHLPRTASNKILRRVLKHEYYEKQRHTANTKG